jgi:ubiquinone/menaquinone biosynthesis C-methylase UbiE
MAQHVCPWWLGWLIDNPLRRLLHHPEKILRPYVRPGMTVIDVGCGRGMFSIALAKLVGEEGRVIAADLQPQMLDAVMRRARRAGIAPRIQIQLCKPDRLGIETPADFILAFAMVHEVPDTKNFLAEIHALLKPGGKFLVAEPRLHVRAAAFEKILALAQEVGLQAVEKPPIRHCRSVVFKKCALG